MNYVEKFKHTLSKATAKIPEEYINLPEAGKEDGKYREQVYCYELYHQLRLSWPESLRSFSLSGELYKLGHLKYENTRLSNVKPDLLIHIPGNTKNNKAVVEVKSLNGISRDDEFKSDLEKLTSFRSLDEADYDSAIHLTYSNERINPDQILCLAQSIQEKSDDVNLEVIEFWGHGPPGTEAYPLDQSAAPAT